jgi:outer membrane receptor protein involved in Fe transport
MILSPRVLFTGALLASATTPVLAQTASGEALTEIVITAKKQPETLRTVAEGVSVLDGQDLVARGVAGLEDFARFIPSMNVTGTDPSGNRQIVLRGVSPSGNPRVPTVVVYLDDTQIPNFLDPQIYDVARLEVLKGPQGHLYGASAIGGVIRYVPNAPDPTALAGSAEASSFATRHGDLSYGLEGALNLPLTENAAVRFSGVYNEEGGYIRNYRPFTGETQDDVNDSTHITARSEFLWRANEVFDARLAVLYDRYDLRGNPEVDFVEGGIVPRITASSLRDLISSRYTPERDTRDSYVYSLTLQANVSLGTVTSTTSLVSQNELLSNDITDLYQYVPFDETNAYAIGPTNSLTTDRYRTEELRFASSWDFPLGLVVGAYVTSQEQDVIGSLVLSQVIPEEGPFLLDFSSRQKNESRELAQFFNLTWAFADERAKLEIGGRNYHRVEETEQQDTTDEVNFPLGTTPHTRIADDDVLYSLSASYDFSRSLFVYARAASGFRPAVAVPRPAQGCEADLLALGLDPDNPPTFAGAEQARNYEAGLRSELLQSRLSIAATAYSIDYDDIQQNVPLPMCGGRITRSVGKARSNGAELELAIRPFENFFLAANYGYTDAELRAPDVVSGGDIGEALQFVPKETASLRGEYSFALPRPEWMATLRADVSYTSRRASDFGLAGEAPDPSSALPSFSLINLQMSFRRGPLELTAFCDNVGDSIPVYSNQNLRRAFDVGRTLSVGRPRTAGLRISTSF